MSRHEQYHQPDKSSISYLIYLEERVAKQDETIEQLQAALTNLAKSPQGFDGYWKDYAMSELRRICPPGKDAT